MKVTFKVDYELGDIVYLVNDPEDLPRFVVGYIYTIDNAVKYVLSSIDADSYHYGFEISSQRAILR